MICAMYGAFFKRRNLTKSFHEFWYMTFNSYIQFGQMRLIIKIIDYMIILSLLAKGHNPYSQKDVATVHV